MSPALVGSGKVDATMHRSDVDLNAFGFTGKLDVGSATGSGSGAAFKANILAATNSESAANGS